MSATRLGRKHSDAHRANLSRALRGMVKVKRYDRVCPCGAAFVTAAHNARFHSRICARAARGHGLRHAPEFAHFPKCCGICSRTNELAGDHDHASGKPRGILCRNCNLGIGNMFDDPARLRAAAAYLERTE